METWKRFDDCETLLSADQIKQTSLLEMLNLIHSAIQTQWKLMRTTYYFLTF